MIDEPVIKVRDVAKNYGALKAVDRLSFSVMPSTCFALLGPNGAGKTTMMKMIYGKAQRNSSDGGTIDVFGYDPKHDELAIKYMSGVVPQDNNLDEELNVEENLLIYSRFYGITGDKARERIGQLLNFLELSEKKKSAIRELSGGMKRRLVIARSLLHDPKLLILDEPTTGLDPQVRHLIWDKLRQLKKSGTTLLLTTHYMEEASQLCDSILIMNKGVMIMEGNPAGLLGGNIEKYVVEIHGMPAIVERVRKVIDENIRMDGSSEMVRLFSNDLDSLKAVADTIDHKEYIMRPSNLEDLFLKATGTKLNEQQ